MTSFSDLPIDVIDIINTFSDDRTVEALSRVSQSLRRISEPHLYRLVSLKITSKTLLDPQASFGVTTDKLFQLLRTLRNKPELASAIKRVILELEDYDDAPLLARQFAVDLHELNFISKVDQPVCFKDALISFFQNLHGLHYLQIPFGSASHFNFLLQLKEYPLWNLRTVCYSPFPQLNTWSRHEGKDTDLSLLFAFLNAPLLVTLDIVLPGVRLGQVPLLSTTSLKTLILRHSQFSPSSLAILLGATKTLERLQYDYDCDLDALYKSSYDCVNDWGNLREGLKSVARTLKHLSIALDFHYWEDYKDDDWDPRNSWAIRGRLGDISFLEKLESLEVPLPILLGWDPADARALQEVLPKSLLQLGLRDDLVDWFEYHWTPWNSAVIGKLLDSSFQNTVDASPVLSQLGTIAFSSETELRTVTLLMSNHHHWPGRWLSAFFQIFHDTKIGMSEIQAKVLLRMGDEDDDNTQDLVREMTRSGDEYCNDDLAMGDIPQYCVMRPHTTSVTHEWPRTDRTQTQPHRDVSQDRTRVITYWIDKDGKKCSLSYNMRELRLPPRIFKRHT
jgi:hypothetical protein